MRTHPLDCCRRFRVCGIASEVSVARHYCCYDSGFSKSGAHPSFEKRGVSKFATLKPTHHNLCDSKSPLIDIFVHAPSLTLWLKDFDDCLRRLVSRQHSALWSTGVQYRQANTDYHAFASQIAMSDLFCFPGPPRREPARTLSYGPHHHHHEVHQSNLFNQGFRPCQQEFS